MRRIQTEISQEATDRDGSRGGGGDAWLSFTMHEQIQCPVLKFNAQQDITLNN